MDPTVGAFMHYICTTDHNTFGLPDSMLSEQGVPMVSGIPTISLALFSPMKVTEYPLEPLPKSKYVLVYGGNAVTRPRPEMFVGPKHIKPTHWADPRSAQGLRRLAICSLWNFDLVRSRGAKEGFDLLCY